MLVHKAPQLQSKMLGRQNPKKEPFVICCIPCVTDDYIHSKIKSKIIITNRNNNVYLPCVQFLFWTEGAMVSKEKTFLSESLPLSM